MCQFSVYRTGEWWICLYFPRYSFRVKIMQHVEPSDVSRSMLRVLQGYAFHRFTSIAYTVNPTHTTTSRARFLNGVGLHFHLINCFEKAAGGNSNDEGTRNTLQKALRFCSALSLYFNSRRTVMTWAVTCTTGIFHTQIIIFVTNYFYTNESFDAAVQ
jgi:hypothetical protein